MADQSRSKYSAERLAGTLADALVAGDYRRILRRFEDDSRCKYSFSLLTRPPYYVVKVAGKVTKDESERLVHGSKVKAI